MPLVSLRQLLDHAAEHRYGIPAFNVNNLEQVKAIMAAVEAHPHVPVVMHQDHGASPAVCVQAIRSGFSSVMMDGSLLADAKTPSCYKYNIDVNSTHVDALAIAFRA